MRTLLYCGIFLTLIASPASRADADTEREILAQLVQELRLLETLIDRAEQAAEPSARIRFRYDWLREDLERVRQGIEEHGEVPRIEPRAVLPLRGDYRR
jgi:RAQPRD family integrative conjugative element protein